MLEQFPARALWWGFTWRRIPSRLQRARLLSNCLGLGTPTPPLLVQKSDPLRHSAVSAKISSSRWLSKYSKRKKKQFSCCIFEIFIEVVGRRCACNQTGAEHICIPFPFPWLDLRFERRRPLSDCMGSQVMPTVLCPCWVPGCCASGVVAVRYHGATVPVRAGLSLGIGPHLGSPCLVISSPPSCLELPWPFTRLQHVIVQYLRGRQQPTHRIWIGDGTWLSGNGGFLCWSDSWARPSRAIARFESAATFTEQWNETLV